MFVTTLAITAIGTLVVLVVLVAVVLGRARGILDDVARIEAALMPHVEVLQERVRIATEEIERIGERMDPDAHGAGVAGEPASPAPGDSESV